MFINFYFYEFFYYDKNLLIEAKINKNTNDLYEKSLAKTSQIP